MGLEELTFDIEGVERIKVIVKPELHKYHYNAAHDPAVGTVPVTIKYGLLELISPCVVNPFVGTMPVTTTDDRYGHPSILSGFLNYDASRKIFITPLSDFIPTDFRNTGLLEKYARGMSEAAKVYSILLDVKDPKTLKSVIQTKNFYRNSNREWKDIGDWQGVESHDELLKKADAVK